MNFEDPEATALEGIEKYEQFIKSIGMMAMSYGYVYVAQVAMGYDPEQTLKAMKEAEAYDGPSIIICYCPCRK